MGLPTSIPLLPAHLQVGLGVLVQALGYSTHGLGKWHLGYCSPDYLPTRWPTPTSG